MICPESTPVKVAKLAAEAVAEPTIEESIMMVLKSAAPEPVALEEVKRTLKSKHGFNKKQVKRFFEEHVKLSLHKDRISMTL